MIKFINNNPFRILGVYSNASAKDISANTSRIKAYVKVGRNISFEQQLNDLLPTLDYDENALNNATSMINLPKDKLKSALFWFVKDNALDDIALNNLQIGNVEKSKEIWQKKETFSSLINLGILYCIEDNISALIENISKVIHTTQYRNAFISSICGDTFAITENDLAELFINTLLEEKDVFDIWEMYNDLSFFDNNYSNEINYLNNKITDKIDEEISKAKVDGHKASDNLNAGRKLKKFAEDVLPKIKQSFGIENSTYQMICDKLARQILQNGINYYNESEGSLQCINKALILQQYALKIAIGNIIKQRCQENVNILLKIKEEEETYGNIRYNLEIIHKTLDSLKKITTISFIKDTTDILKSELLNIKSKLGSNNETYINISSGVVNDVLNNIIRVLNSKQEKKEAKTSLRIIEILETFDMSVDMSKRLQQNKNILIHNINLMPSAFEQVNEKTNGCLSYIIGWIVVMIIIKIITSLLGD